MEKDFEQMANEEISAKDIQFVLSELMKHRDDEMIEFANCIHDKVPTKKVLQILENAQVFYESNEM